MISPRSKPVVLLYGPADGASLMAKKGISVKQLARELGVTSRQVIDRCRAEGLFVQNSITKLDIEAERQVRAWFSRAGLSETPTS